MRQDIAHADPDTAQGTPDAARSMPARLTIALAWINAKQARDRAFSTDLFSDPPWDILLDLYVNLCRKRLVSISDLYTACPTPPTTILRWIAILEERNLVERHSDPTDRRRRHVSLTPAGIDKMERALDGATESDRRLGLGRILVTPPIGRN
jgi:DNA-binding MarR family transcriptional regulator